MLGQECSLSFTWGLMLPRTGPSSADAVNHALLVWLDLAVVEQVPG